LRGVEGTLIENASERLEPDQNVSEVAEAYEAVHRLRRFLEDEITETFYDWFREQYGMRPDPPQEAPLGWAESAHLRPALCGAS
jgi:hypothetical protein